MMPTSGEKHVFYDAEYGSIGNTQIGACIKRWSYESDSGTALRHDSSSWPGMPFLHCIEKYSYAFQSAMFVAVFANVPSIQLTADSLPFRRFDKFFDWINIHSNFDYWVKKTVLKRLSRNRGNKFSSTYWHDVDVYAVSPLLCSGLLSSVPDYWSGFHCVPPCYMPKCISDYWSWFGTEP